MVSSRMNRIIIYFLVAIVVIIVLFPIYWMVIVSFKPPLEYLARTPSLFPLNPTFSHFAGLWEGQFHRYLFNTVIIALSSTIISLIFGFLAAYALARFKFPAKLDLVFLLWVLLVRMVPPITLAISLFDILGALGLVNTKLGLILVYQIYTLPFSIWMLLGFIRNMGMEMEEAAAIDGASKIRILRSIVLPLIAPGLAATAIFSVIMSWNEFIYALLFLRTPSIFTLPIHVARHITEYKVLWGELMAIGVMSSLPILIFAGFVQRHLLRGFAMGLK